MIYIAYDITMSGSRDFDFFGLKPSIFTYFRTFRARIFGAEVVASLAERSICRILPRPQFLN